MQSNVSIIMISPGTPRRTEGIQDQLEHMNEACHLVQAETGARSKQLMQQSLDDVNQRLTTLETEARQREQQLVEKNRQFQGFQVKQFSFLLSYLSLLPDFSVPLFCSFLILNCSLPLPIFLHCSHSYLLFSHSKLLSSSPYLSTLLSFLLALFLILNCSLPLPIFLHCSHSYLLFSHSKLLSPLPIVQHCSHSYLLSFSFYPL